VSLPEVLGIVVLVLLGVVLFLVLPALAVWKARPEIRRMRQAPRLPPGEKPINGWRAMMRAADRADVHRIRPRPRSERDGTGSDRP
jgi:hypothetical protein